MDRSQETTPRRDPASMKGFPRRGSNLRLDRLEQADALLASMKGFPRRGSNHGLDDDLHGLFYASMKGFPRRGSNAR